MSLGDRRAVQRRHVLQVLAVVVVVVGIEACGSAATQHTAGATRAAQTATTTPSPSASTTFDVTRFGATGDGKSDNTTAFANAIAAAQAAGAGATVSVPPGQFLFSGPARVEPASVLITGVSPITLQGSGRDKTFLIEAVKGKGLLSVFPDGTTVSDMTLDTQTHDGGAALFVRANHTSLLRTRVLGGPDHFAIFYAGPAGAVHGSPTYNVGNVVDDLILDELVCSDGFSWSFQENSSISNVTHTGSRLALYVDADTTVTNYQYTPGPQPCDARNGFWLTPPGNNITIVNFVSSGEGGKVAVTGAGQVSQWVADNVTIRGMTLTGRGYQIAIGDVRNLLLEDCNLGSNAIVVQAQTVAQGSIVRCTYSQLLRQSPAHATIALSTG